MGRLKVADRLNHNQRRVLDLLLAVNPYIIKFRDIADALDMREASVRTIMRRLSALAFLSFQKARDGNIQGIQVAFNQRVIEQYQQDQTLNPNDNLSQSHTINHFIENRESQSATPALSQPVNPSSSQAVPQSMPSKIERKETLSIQEAFGWDDAFLELMWPTVFAAGFRMEQIRQIVEARARLGKEIDREVVTLSLDRAEWELVEKGMLVNLTTKEKVRNVPAYIFTALARWGALRAHPEYVSQEELAAAAVAEELKKRREAAENLETARFERFLAELDVEETERIMTGFPGGSREAWIKNYWRKNVRDA
jgi:predicted transcriptional regulator